MIGDSKTRLVANAKVVESVPLGPFFILSARSGATENGAYKWRAKSVNDTFQCALDAVMCAWRQFSATRVYYTRAYYTHPNKEPRIVEEEEFDESLAALGLRGGECITFCDDS
jgi:hypothetical protein